MWPESNSLLPLFASLIHFYRPVLCLFADRLIHGGPTFTNFLASTAAVSFPCYVALPLPLQSFELYQRLWFSSLGPY